MENDFKFNNKKQMKKLLLLTMLAIITLPIMSQTHFLNAFELITTDGVNDSRKSVDISIILNASDKRITIYSNEIQIIDYVVRYNAKTNCGGNYMTRNFADTYFSKKDC